MATFIATHGVHIESIHGLGNPGFVVDWERTDEANSKVYSFTTGEAKVAKAIRDLPAEFRKAHGITEAKDASPDADD